MARQSASSSESSQKQRQKAAPNKAGAGSGTKAKAASPSDKKAKKAAAQQQQAPGETIHFFDDQMRRDLAGVILAVLAVALLVTAVMPANGVITSVVSSGLHLAFGIGTYLLPFALLLVSLSFFVQLTHTQVSLRLSVGLTIIFVGILGLLALFTPNAQAAPGEYLFVVETLTARGGYVGAGVAWAGLTLLGKPVSLVIVIGLIVVGATIVAIAVTQLVAHLRAWRADREAERGVEPPEPSARVRRGHAGGASKGGYSSEAFQEEPPRAAQDGYDPGGEEPVTLAIVPTKGKATRRLRKNREPDASSAPRSAYDPVPVAATVPFPDPAPTPQPEPAPAPEPEPVYEAPAVGRRKDPLAEAAGVTVPLTRKLGRRRSGEEPAVVKRPVAPSPSDEADRPDDEGGFRLPSMVLLHSSGDGAGGGASESELAETASCLQGTLEDFGLMVHVAGWVAGPTVTLFKIELPAGVRVSRITALEDDIALALAAPGVRIYAPVPGTNYVGIEVPNRTRQTVLLGDVLRAAKSNPLEIAIGKDVEGNAVVTDLAKMPHLLIGGTTGSGKSVSINAMIMSILMRATPDQVRFILIDPKRVEFTPYNGIPHLYVPVVTEPNEAASALSWGVAEMERRLKMFSKVGVRNIGQYNAKVQAEIAAQRQAQAAGEEPPAGELGAEVPYLVIVIDELADLMMNVGKEVEFSISRLAQLARAAGIHLIVATQRPSTNVVTGLIKANITNRIAFNVASGIDSRVILDTPGAENLIGLGDMLFSKPEYAKPQRIQGCFVTEEEINAVVEFLKAQAEPDYHSEILQTNLITLGASAPDGSGGTCDADDPLLWEAAEIVVSTGLGSTSNIQRRLKVGYSRAGRIMDMLENKGIVGPPNGSKPREVLVDELELETLKAFETHDVSGAEG